MDVPDCRIRKQNPELQVIIRLLVDGSIDCRLPLSSVLGMNPLKPFFPGGHPNLWIKTINAIAFLRQIHDLPWGYLPNQTSHVAKSLRLCQMSLTPPQSLLRLLLAGQIEDVRYSLVRLVLEA